MYKPVIGLEIHVELKTKSKMFCSCPNDPEKTKPNTNICPVCLGHPGTLPVANKKAILKVMKAGLALNSEIPEYSKFDRKNYFYPDLPKGYQISQYDKPLCKGGHLEVDDRKINLTRIHLEEDTGKLIHPEDKDYSLIDFNRAGVPLMELVTEPEIESAKEAKRFAEKLRLILRYLNISDANMEKGQMRCEANISLKKEEDDEFGTKIEIKNLNSFKALEKGIDYEIKRQKKKLEKGEKIIQATRGWDDKKERTFSQRVKEEAKDYRYFPEPDLPILHLGTKKRLEKIKNSLPELPDQKEERFKKEYSSLKEEQIEFLVKNLNLANYFENVVSEIKNWIKAEDIDKEKTKKTITISANYLITDLQSLLNENNIEKIKKCKINPENFAEFIVLLIKGDISSKIAKKILKQMFKKGEDPSKIVKREGLKQISDEDKIENVIDKVIKENPEPVQDYKDGEENALQFLVGQVMKKTKGKANPQTTQKILNQKLEE